MEENLNKNVQEKEQTYQIYEYMKTHHSLLIACVSAVVAVASLLTYLLIYVVQCIRLNVWNVSAEIIGEVGKGNYFYAIIFGTLFYLVIPIGDQWLGMYFDKILYLLEFMKLQKGLLKKLSDYPNTKEEKRFVKKRALGIRKKVNRLRRKVVYMGISLLFVFGIVWVIFYIFFQISLVKIDWRTFVVLAFGLTVVFGSLLFKYKALHRNVMMPELKKRAQEVRDFESACDLLMEICDFETDVTDSRKKDKKFKEYLSDEGIASGVSMVGGAFLTLGVALVLVSFVSAYFQKEFWIYRDAMGREYAVVYQNEKQVVLEEAEIDGETISIYMGKQLFQTYEGNAFEYMKFEEVKRIGTNHD